MLHIYFGDMPDAIYNTEVFFKNTYEEEWFQDSFAREIVKKIDKSEILDVNAIKSPLITPGIISGTVIFQVAYAGVAPKSSAASYVLLFTCLSFGITERMT